MLKLKHPSNLFIFIFVFFIVSCNVNNSYKPNKDPNYIELQKLADSSLTKIKFNMDTLHLRAIKNDSLLVSNFVIYNIGEKKLNIKSYITSCECTKIKLNKFSANPKDSIKISVYIDREKLNKGISNRFIVFLGNFKELYITYPIEIKLN